MHCSEFLTAPPMSHPVYLADFSLAVVNRTGAYYVCKEVIDHLPEFFPAVRYWRFISERTPPQNLSLKVMSRLMMAEISTLRGAGWLYWPVPDEYQSLPTLFFDPLYVLRNRLRPDDIVVCHDVGPVSHPELFDDHICSLYREAYDKIKSVKPGMIFVSHASRAAFEKHFGSDYRFKEVIRLFTREAAVDGTEQSVPGITKPFTLSVGALETRKNYGRVIDAFQKSNLHADGVSHVICGPRGFGHEHITTAADKTPGIHLLGRVPDAQLRWLYNNAEGFVLPSLLEGFGVPAIEASHKGLVSIVSKGTAQEEAIGSNGLCVDPFNVDAIADAMRKLITMSPLDKKKMSENAAAFARTWTVEDYRHAWRDLLDNNGPRR